MQLSYVPLLQLQRDFYAKPRDMARFEHYLTTITSHDGKTLDLPPLSIMNPMGKEHLLEMLDELIRQSADDLAEQTTKELQQKLADHPGQYQIITVLADDKLGGWTNRYDVEYKLRFPEFLPTVTPRWADANWLSALVWSSEPVSISRLQETIRCAVYRAVYLTRHGRATNLQTMMQQEGWVMKQAGCTEPCLEDDDIEYTREVLQPHLESCDKRTAIECLFGDAAGATLGFSPRGLSPWAGLALALHDA